VGAFTQSGSFLVLFSLPGSGNCRRDTHACRLFLRPPPLYDMVGAGFPEDQVCVHLAVNGFFTAPPGRTRPPHRGITAVYFVSLWSGEDALDQPWYAEQL